jgi:hypothetical protein
LWSALSMTRTSATSRTRSPADTASEARNRGTRTATNVDGVTLREARKHGPERRFTALRAGGADRV